MLVKFSKDGKDFELEITQNHAGFDIIETDLSYEDWLCVFCSPELDRACEEARKEARKEPRRAKFIHKALKGVA